MWSGWSCADRCGGAGLVLVELEACLELDDQLEDLAAFHGRTAVHARLAVTLGSTVIALTGALSSPFGHPL